MSFTPTVGQLIRISSEVIPDTTKDDELVGDLGIPGLMRHAIFEVIKMETDGNRGPIVICRMTNPEVFKTVIPGVKDVKYEGELVLLVKDIVPANTKITLAYTILNGKTKEELIADLFVARKALESLGLDKKTKAMRDNWKEIRVLRGEVAGSMPSATKMVKVYLPKQRLTFELGASQLPSEDEESITKFKRLLTNMVRGVRGNRKRYAGETKVVFGMVSVPKMGGVYLTENSLLKAYEEMMKTTLETDKKPTDPKANYVGIEIEFIFTGKYDVLKRLLIEAKLHRYVCLKNDGSVRQCHNSGYIGKELTLICKDTEVEDVMKRLDSVLANPEIDGYANRSCGLHVHIDVRNRDAALVYKNMVRVQNILRGAQPVGRVNNTHCKANTADDLKKFHEIASNGGGDSRYWVVNGSSIARHSSVEIRIHDGTTDCEAIFNWVTFLNSIANHKTEIPKNELKFAEDLVAKFDINIPLEAIDYVDRRIERFNSLKAI